MKMYLISDNIDTWTGMRLAGVDGAVVHERDELKRELDKVLADKSIGIILLQCKAGAEAAADRRDPGPPRNRPQAGLYHLLCKRGHWTETIESR